MLACYPLLLLLILQPAHDVEETDQDKYLIEAFTATDVTERKQLPLFVVFKGFNDYFLGGQVINRNNFLQFSKVSMEDPTALQIVSTNNNGVVRIKSNPSACSGGAAQIGSGLIQLTPPDHPPKP